MPHSRGENHEESTRSRSLCQVSSGYISADISRAKFRALAQPRHRNFIHLSQMCSRWVSPDALEMCTVLPKLQLPGPLPDRAHIF